MSNDVKKQARRRRRKEKRRKRKRAMDAETINARLEQLRELVYDGPTPHAWTRICEQLHAWPDDPSLDMAIDYADHHMADWPDTLKLGAGTAYSWLLSVLDGRREPRARLIRVARLRPEHATPERMGVLLSKPFTDQLVGLDLNSPRAAHHVLHHLGQRDNSHLKVLRLGGCHLRQDALELLRQGNFSRLEVLDLSYNLLNTRACTVLARELHLPRLHTLNLAGNSHIAGSTQKHLKELASAPFWPQLIDLDLSSRSTDIAQIKELLETRPNPLKRLAINWVSLASRRQQMLLSALLEGYDTLERLELGGCLLGHHGVRAVAAMDLPNLRDLDLACNTIQHGTLYDLIATLPRTMPRLEHLALNDNPLLPELAHAMAKRLNFTPRLTIATKTVSEQTLAKEIHDTRLVGLGLHVHALALLHLWSTWPHAITHEHIAHLVEWLLNPPQDADPPRLSPDIAERLDKMLERTLFCLGVPELRRTIREQGIRGYSKLRKNQLVAMLHGVLSDRISAIATDD